MPGMSTRNLGNYGGVEGITQQQTKIPQTVTSPKTAYFGAQQKLTTESPFIALNFIIALQGIFPSQN
jgi:microcystin-dependent protein